MPPRIVFAQGNAKARWGYPEIRTMRPWISAPNMDRTSRRQDRGLSETRMIPFSPTATQLPNPEDATAYKEKPESIRISGFQLSPSSVVRKMMRSRHHDARCGFSNVTAVKKGYGSERLIETRDQVAPASTERKIPQSCPTAIAVRESAKEMDIKASWRKWMESDSRFRLRRPFGWHPRFRSPRR